MHAAGLLYPVGPTVVEFIPGGDPVTLEIGISDTDTRQHFRSLKWFVNSVKLDSSAERFLVSEDGRMLTITSPVEEDAGVYEATFTGLVTPFHNLACEVEKLDLFRSYPIAEPVSFILVNKGLC